MELRRVVVGFDRSDEATEAAKWAVSNSPPDGRVELVEVVHGVEDATGESLTRAAAVIGGVDDGPTVLPVVVRGSNVADTLLEKARLEGAEAIVLGAGSHQRWHPHRVSPTAARLHHRGTLPMITVRQSASPRGPICVGVDGTEKAWTTLRWIIDRSSAQDEIRAVWVVGEGVRGDMPTLPVANMDVLKAAVGAYLELQVDAIGGERAQRVETEVRVGYATAGLLDSAARCAILAVGHEHHSRLGEMFGTSVSLQLLREFDRITIVVP